MDLPEIVCVLVVYPDGERLFESLAEYLTNPAAGTYILTEQRKRKYEPATT